MIKIKTALLSVYDKTGIIELAQHLAKNNIEILSSGGTAKHLIENGIKDVIVVITHGIFSGQAIHRLNSCNHIKKVVVSNSIYQDKNILICSKIEIINIDDCLSTIIERLSNNKSLSELFT